MILITAHQEQDAMQGKWVSRADRANVQTKHKVASQSTERGASISPGDVQSINDQRNRGGRRKDASARYGIHRGRAGRKVSWSEPRQDHHSYSTIYLPAPERQRPPTPTARMGYRVVSAQVRETSEPQQQLQQRQAPEEQGHQVPVLGWGGRAETSQ